MSKVITVLEMTYEAASRSKGAMLKKCLEILLSSKPDSIVVDFDGISLFSTVFFNNSFAALALVYGFDIIRAIHLENISEVGLAAYESSMANAEIVSREKCHGEKDNREV